MVSLETAYLTPSMHSILKSNNNKALYPGNVNPMLRQACKTQVFICFNKQLKVQAAQSPPYSWFPEAHAECAAKKKSC